MNSGKDLANLLKDCSIMTSAYFDEEENINWEHINFYNRHKQFIESKNTKKDTKKL